MANIATTITEIIDLKIRGLAEAAKDSGPMNGEINRLTPAEGWVGKKETAAHLKISLRTLDGWMKKGVIPISINLTNRKLLEAL